MNIYLTRIQVNSNLVNLMNLSCIVDIETTTQFLDFRVRVLEENGGDDGNSSVAELEVRVEALEGTTADHETRLTTAETDIEGLRKNSEERKGF